MALSTFVKIGGITNLSDARYCSGMYVDLLGFSLEEDSLKFVSPTQFSEITGWIAGTELVGEFETDDFQTIQAKLEKYPNITWIEHTRLAPLLSLQALGLKPIYKADIQEIIHIEPELAAKLKTHGVLLHLTSNHKKLQENELETVKKISGEIDVILSAGLTQYNVKELIQDLHLKGIALEGGEEIKPGLKDFDELAEILEVLEVED